MIKSRASICLFALLLLFALLEASASAAFPEGPRLTVVREPILSAEPELITTDSMGLDSQRLTGFRAGGFFSDMQSISWSNDGSRLAFAARARGSTRTFTIDAAGGPPKAVKRTANGDLPVISPDGTRIAFCRLRIHYRSGVSEEDSITYVSVSIWIVDSDGGRARRVTPWQNKLLLLPSSFSPDGTELAASRFQGGRRSEEIVSVRVSDGRVRRIATRGTEPAYSPDGSSIAYVATARQMGDRYGERTKFDVFTVGADGSSKKRVTSSPEFREVAPKWEPSGQGLVFIQSQKPFTSPGEEFATGTRVVAVNADGTCPRTLLQQASMTYLAAAWRPGPGREVGRIAC